jgi:hypothetical protein
LANLSAEQYSKGWTKLWWVFQKLDDRYGPTWYPRWVWVKNTRWQDDRPRALTWDEVVEDMSIAVGEDLFPFFRKIGARLSKERFPEAAFQGRKLLLPIAPLSLGPAGQAKLDRIGDYRAPLPLAPRPAP